LLQILCNGVVQFPSYAVHRLQSNFVDPDEFQPERFSTENFKFVNVVVFSCFSIFDFFWQQNIYVQHSICVKINICLLLRIKEIQDWRVEKHLRSIICSNDVSLFESKVFSLKSVLF